jgi:DNA-binding transcriptional MerR regulator
VGFHPSNVIVTIMKQTFKAGEVSKRIGVHGNTVRNWSSEYADFLTPEAVGSGSGSRRRFTDQDALVLATIADLRAKGFTREQVIAALQAGRLKDSLPNLPAPEEEAARRDVALVPVAQLQRALDEVQRVRDELDRVIAERDRALERGDKVSAELNAHINELKAELGRAQGQLAERFSARFVIGLVICAAALAIVVVLLLRA